MKNNHPARASPPRIGRPRDWVVGGLLLGVLVLGVSQTIGWRALLAPWRELTWGALLLPFSLTALSYFFRGVRIYDYFRPGLDGRFSTVLRLSVFHTTANNLLPMRAGEMVFPWLMGRYFGCGFLDAAASLVWIRLLDLHFLGLMGIFILYLRQPSWIWLLAALGWLVLPLLASLAAGLIPKGTGKLGKAFQMIGDAAPENRGLVLRIYLWTALTWVTKFLAFAFVLQHFLPLEVWQIMAGVMGAELSSILPFHGIAGSGSYEAAVVVALVPLGVSAVTAMAGAVNLHLFLLGTTLILGASALLLPTCRNEMAAAER